MLKKPVIPSVSFVVDASGCVTRVPNSPANPNKATVAAVARVIASTRGSK
jgi:hypothetical protein